MKKLGILVVFVFLISMCFASAYSIQEQERDTLIIIKSLDLGEFKEVIGFLNGYGKVRHAYPNEGIFIGKFSLNNYKKISRNENVKKITYSGVNNFKGYTLSQIKIIKSWNLLEKGNKIRYDPELKKSWSEIGIEGVVDDKPFLERKLYQKSLIGGLGGHDQSYYKTSEYFIGSTSVGIIFPESNGSIDPNLEDWTSAEEVDAIAKIRNGLDWYVNFEPRANLSFVYDIHYRVPTGYEPISRPHTEATWWINEALGYLGYNEVGVGDDTYAYVNNMRNTFGTDWGFIAWIADASEDDDGLFSDGWGAWTSLGGPSLVVSNAAENLDTTIAHETGHVFNALDEYCAPGLYCCSCAESSGYYDIPNSNCGAGCPDGDCTGGEPECNGCNQCTNVDCIMHGSTWNACSVTQQQWGWIDSDGDNIFDPVDPNDEYCHLDLPNQLLIDEQGFVYYTTDMKTLKTERIDTSEMEEEDKYFDGVLVAGDGNPSLCHLPENTQAFIVYGCCNTVNRNAQDWDNIWSKFVCQNGFDRNLNDGLDPRYPDFDLDGKLEPYPEDFYPIPNSETNLGFDIYCGWNIYVNWMFYPAGQGKVNNLLTIPDNGQKSPMELFNVLHKPIGDKKIINKMNNKKKYEGSLFNRAINEIRNFIAINRKSNTQ